MIASVCSTCSSFLPLSTQPHHHLSLSLPFLSIRPLCRLIRVHEDGQALVGRNPVTSLSLTLILCLHNSSLSLFRSHTHHFITSSSSSASSSSVGGAVSFERCLLLGQDRHSCCCCCCCVPTDFDPKRSRVCCDEHLDGTNPKPCDWLLIVVANPID